MDTKPAFVINGRRNEYMWEKNNKFDSQKKNNNITDTENVSMR